MQKIQKITFCIPSKTNLRYLKTAIPSIRKNSYRKDHDIIVFVDSDEDGTVEWLKENAESLNVKYYVNPNLGKSLYGIGRAYDYCIDKAETDIVMIFHADMMLGKNADYNVFKHLKPLSVVCSTRIEPPIHPNNGEKILEDFGMYPEEFKESSFDSYVDNLIIKNNDKTTNGIFAPWMVYKKDIQSVGGHDSIMHSCREDSDLFNRFAINKYQLIQSWDSLVYHLTGRGAGSFDGDSKRHENWKIDMKKSTLEFIRKWGHFVKHDRFMKPIVPNRYDIGFVVHNCNENILKILEPWCDTLYSNLNYSNYISEEQPNTKFNLSKKLKPLNVKPLNDIIVEFDTSRLTNNNSRFINILSEILQDSGQVGNMEYDIFKIKINELKDYKHNLIHINNQWYKNKLL